LEAATDAIDHTQRFLFPPRLDRWLALGLVAFLDQCGRQGGVSVPGTGWEDSGSGKGPDVSGLLAWFGEHVGLVVLLTALGLAFGVAVTALVVWLSSRGILMYVDDVATGRSDVVRPWREHREAASSLFAWRFGLALALLLGVLLLVLAGAFIVFGLARGTGRSAAAGAGLIALVPLVLMLLGMALAGGLASVALRDFVAPLQLLHRTPCGPAVRTLLGLLRQQPGAFVVYVLLKVVFVMLAATVALAVCCVTCGCVLLPVVGQTLLQPLFYFERAWSLHLLRRFGHDLMAGLAPPASPQVPPPAPPLALPTSPGGVTSFDTPGGTGDPGEA
jgi:hypothetical protein